MRIAVSTDGSQVAPHFGRCEKYTIFDVEDSKVEAREVVESPGHAPGAIPAFLKEKGCTLIIAGGMGRRAKDLFRQADIDWIVGVRGEVDSVINDYLSDTLEVGESSCEHGEGHGNGTHGCGH
ncbi:MAG TPA: NifB/NifX family molybdenum-iron cluster-binding protein [Candidatus Krumholzibacteriaceae bacterium]|nr:NifB/NifX family molybdenum-iron cluster-binding protein [Candidatus Krumholzibacteriaceae bacterium]